MLDADGIPVDGVCYSLGRIDFKPEATKSQKSQAQLILDSFDPASIVEEPTELEQLRAKTAKLEAQMIEVSKTIPAVATVEAVADSEVAPLK